MAKSHSQYVEIAEGDFLLQQEAVLILAGCSKPTFNKWRQEANPPPRNPDGTYSAREIGKWLRDVYPKRPKPGRPAGMVDTSDETGRSATARLELAKAIKAERENALAEGEIIPKGDVETAWQTILMRVRSRMLKIPTTLARLVHGDDDIFSIEAKLKAAVHEALEEASEDWRDAGDLDDDDE